MRKLSASSISTFLRSPKAFYYSHVLRLRPIQQSVANFDHDKLCGSLWAEYVDRFYKGVGEVENHDKTIAQWLEQTEGWVPIKVRDKLTGALEAWMMHYQQNFSPTDGCRNKDKSELWLENDRFVAKLDGLSDDSIVHEVKSTSRAASIAEQQWKVEHSLQVRLYCVLAKAKGYCVEFAYKDSPFQLYRGPVTYVGELQLATWEQELNALADSIYALGDDPNHYPCHTDGCNLTTKGYTSMCNYQLLCDQGINEDNLLFYKKRQS